MNLLFDLETDNLLPDTSKIHCIVAYDLDTDELHSFNPQQLDEGIALLQQATCLVGHNIASYDLPVLEKLVPDWHSNAVLIDTLAVSRMMFIATLRNADFVRNKRNPEFTGEYINRYSLEAWGMRLGEKKSSFGKTADWSTWTQEMQDYCEQDVKVNVKLFRFLRDFERMGKTWSVESMITESECAYVIGKQERNGVEFDRVAAGKLYGMLQQKRVELREKLQDLIKPWEVKGEKFVPKANNKKYGYTKGVATRKASKWIDFNPGSDQHVARVLQKEYGWKPTLFTKTGPKVDEDVLSDLPYPIVPDILEYKILDKRIGSIAEGRKAWLNFEEEGRIYGRVHVTGCRTSRMSHNSPNLGQVPRVSSPYGIECRELFGPRKGWYFVGADASGLELRVLGNRLARWDGGAFAAQAIDGDPHSYMMEGTGIHLRDNQKTWTYAKLYGAFPPKLGSVILKDRREAKALGLYDGPIPGMKAAPGLGKASEQELMKRMPALKHLLKACAAADKRGWIKLLDGRLVKSVSEHSSLNTLCQGDGAVIMKRAQVHFHQELTRLQLREGYDYGYCLTVHDEWQTEAVSQPVAHTIGEAACAAITRAGEELDMRCPLAGEYKVGMTWADTH